MSKKLQAKQERRRAEEERRAAHRRAQRRTNLLTIGSAVLVAALVAGGIYFQRNQGDGDDAVEENVGVAAAEAGCGEVEDPSEQGADHIEVGSQHEPYSSDPPTSGPHYASPAEAGFYSSPLEPEQLVHNLEHGFIVVWYRPDAPQDVVDDIEELTQQEPLATVASPYDGIETGKNFVLSAWGHLQSCESVSQEVVDDFRTEFQGRGPELIAPVFEG